MAFNAAKFGERLRILRGDWPLYLVAIELGINFDVYKRFEAGTAERGPTAKTIGRILDRWPSITADWLLGFSNEELPLGTVRPYRRPYTGR